MKKIILSGLITLCSLNYANTQRLGVGDKVPDIVFKHVLNSKQQQIKLSAYKGKWVLLDFWTTFCGSCIDAFPKIESLQRKFKGHLQILLVDSYDPRIETDDRVKTVMRNFQQRTGLVSMLPIPIHDTLLNRYFPWKSVPHEVLIDPQGRIRAITNAWNITEENIAALIAGEKNSLPLKDDAFDKKVPLLVDGNGGGSGEFLFRSLFTKGYISGGSAGIRTNEKGEVIGFYQTNSSLMVLLNIAYRVELSLRPDCRIVFEVKDRRDFQRESVADLQTMPFYGYDLTISPISRKTFDAGSFLREDLRRFFNVTVQKEERMIPVYVITREIDDSLAKGAEQPKSDFDRLSKHHYVHGYTPSDTFEFLESFTDKPLLDESTVKQPIDLDFPDNTSLDTQTILQTLTKAGWRVRQEKRSVSVAVIKQTR